MNQFCVAEAIMTENGVNSNGENVAMITCPTMLQHDSIPACFHALPGTSVCLSKFSMILAGVSMRGNDTYVKFKYHDEDAIILYINPNEAILVPLNEQYSVHEQSPEIYKKLCEQTDAFIDSNQYGPYRERVGA
jgi:hypothetical protein